MKRDLELVKQILLECERNPTRNGILKIEGYEEEDVLHHIRLMDEACLIEMNKVLPGNQINKITWKGYDYLDSLRQNHDAFDLLYSDLVNFFKRFKGKIR